jgi:hypothetical protein
VLRGDWGSVSRPAAAARKQSASGSIGDGNAEWSAVHAADAARPIRLGPESAPSRAPTAPRKRTMSITPSPSHPHEESRRTSSPTVRILSALSREKLSSTMRRIVFAGDELDVSGYWRPGRAGSGAHEERRS